MSKKKILIVMGNAPSLRDVDFSLLDDFDTFGINSSYRAYYRMKWYPTYHGCFDHVVTENHKESFKEFVESSEAVKNFFYLQQVSDDPRVRRIELLPFGSSFRWNDSPADFSSFMDNGNSGANACSVGVCLGYEKIILLGIDCNYVEFVDGCKRDGAKLVMDKTPDTNPNYWFDDYQQKGDEYNVPRGEDFHRPSWNMFAYRAAHANIEVVNCSPVSTLRCFRKGELSEELRE